eukprot:gene25149-10780_t
MLREKAVAARLARTATRLSNAAPLRRLHAVRSIRDSLANGKPDTEAGEAIRMASTQQASDEWLPCSSPLDIERELMNLCGQAEGGLMNLCDHAEEEILNLWDHTEGELMNLCGQAEEEIMILCGQSEGSSSYPPEDFGQFVLEGYSNRATTNGSDYSLSSAATSSLVSSLGQGPMAMTRVMGASSYPYSDSPLTPLKTTSPGRQQGFRRGRRVKCLSMAPSAAPSLNTAGVSQVSVRQGMPSGSAPVRLIRSSKLAPASVQIMF